MKNHKSCIASLLLLLALASNVPTWIALTTAHIVVAGIFAIIGIGCMFLALVVFESKLNALLDIKDCAERLNMRAAAATSAMKLIEARIDTAKSQSETMTKQVIDLDFSVREAAKMLEDRQNAVLVSLSNIDRHLCNGLNGVLDCIGSQQDTSQEQTAV